MVYLLYAPVIDHYNALHHLTRAVDGGAAGVFFTHPGLAITPLHAFMDEIVLTALAGAGHFRGDGGVQHHGAGGQFRGA